MRTLDSTTFKSISMKAGRSPTVFTTIHIEYAFLLLMWGHCEQKNSRYRYHLLIHWSSLQTHRTPLHLAVMECLQSTVNILLGKGANCLIKDKVGILLIKIQTRLCWIFGCTYHWSHTYVTITFIFSSDTLRWIMLNCLSTQKYQILSREKLKNK